MSTLQYQYWYIILAYDVYQPQNSPPFEVNEDLLLAESCVQCIHKGSFPFFFTKDTLTLLSNVPSFLRHSCSVCVDPSSNFLNNNRGLPFLLRMDGFWIDTRGRFPSPWTSKDRFFCLATAPLTPSKMTSN